MSAEASPQNENTTTIPADDPKRSASNVAKRRWTAYRHRRRHVHDSGFRQGHRRPFLPHRHVRAARRRAASSPPRFRRDVQPCWKANSNWFFAEPNRNLRAGETVNIPANAPHQFHNCVEPAGAHAVHLRPGGPGRILSRTWHSSRNSNHTSTETGRSRASCVRERRPRPSLRNIARSYCLRLDRVA